MNKGVSHKKVVFTVFLHQTVILLIITYRHYTDALMTTMTSQITSLTVVYSIAHSGADQRKHQSSASLAFARGIHRRPVNSPQKWPVTRKMFPFDGVIMQCPGVRWDNFQRLNAASDINWHFASEDVFDSYYARRPVRHRKLHNTGLRDTANVASLVRSIIQCPWC